MLDTALELFNKLPNNYKTKYDKLPKAHKERIKFQNLPENLSIVYMKMIYDQNHH